jgi:uncharacterized protein (DUF983 family)
MAGCGAHRPYRSRAEAQAKLSWHLTTVCPSCVAGKIFDAWLCMAKQHWHIGHAYPEVRAGLKTGQRRA